MRAGEVANALGVSKDTIHNWTKRPEISEFFSPEARGENVTQRIFDESDVLILNTVWWLRNVKKTHEWNKIQDYIKSGERYQEFPKNAISADPRVIPLPQAEQSARAAATLAERDAALKRVGELETEVVHLRREKDEIRDQLTKQHKEETDQLHDRIEKLQREIGRLEARLELLDKQDGS